MEQVKKSSRLQRLARVTGYLFSTIFALALLLQIIFWGGFQWLNGTGGQSWLLQQLDSAMAGSGYSARLTGLHLSVFGTLTADDWQLSDTAGPLAAGKDLRLHVSLSSALTKTLALRISTPTASLLRLPASGDAPKPPAGPFAMPDFYFRRIALKSFHIDALTIDANVFGRELQLMPDLKGDGEVTASGAGFNISGSIEPVNKADALAPFMPQKLTAKGSFDGAQQHLELNEFSAAAPAYSLEAKGAAGFKPGDTLSFIATLKNPDLTAIRGASLAGAAETTLEISGETRAPVAKLVGGVTQLVFRGQNYPDLKWQAEAQNIFAEPAGNFVIAAAAGPLPGRLAGDFAADGAHIALKNVKGSAPDVQLAANLDYDTATGIATGAGDVAGDLGAYQKLLGIKADGKVKVSLTLSAQEGKQAARIEAAATNLSYEQLRVRQGDLTLALADVWQRWPDDIKLKVEDFQAGEFGVPAGTLTLAKQGAAEYRLTASGTAAFRERFKFDGSANISGTGWTNAKADNIKLGIQPAKGSAEITGHASAGEADISLALKGIALSQLPAGLARVVTNGTIHLQGPLSAPDITADTRSSMPSPALSVEAKSSYAKGRLALNASGHGKGIDELAAAITTPMQLSLSPWNFGLPENSGLAGKLAVRGDAGVLSPLFLEAGQSLQGKIAVRLDLSGGLAKPQVAGPVTLNGGKFTARNLGVTLQDISLKADLARDYITLQSLTASDGHQGSVKAAGSASRNGGAAKIDITVRHMDVSRFNENIAGTVSAALNVSGGDRGYVLKGKVTPDQLAITIPERFRTDIPKLNIVSRHRGKAAVASAGARSLALNVAIDAPERVMVRGWGLDAEFGGKLDVTGTAAEPQVNGTLQSRRGRYEEFGKRFTISRAILQFNGPVPPSPYLDVLAETTAEDITGQVALTGPVSKPVIAFSSVPALPQDEVLSRILFGKSMEKISPFQAIQLARTLQRFSGKGSGPDPLGALRGATGLDDINVENSAEGGTTVGAGKYITDKVYLEVGSGSGTGTGKKSGAAKVQVELTPKVKLESKIGQDSEAGAGITWGWDY